ncbi:MAG: ATP-binding protein [Spirosomataceae bacterium]
MNKKILEIDKDRTNQFLPASHNPIVFNWVDTVALNNISELIVQFFNIPITAITLINGNLQWLISKIGLELEYFSVENSLTQYIITNDGIVELKDISEINNLKDAPSELFNENIQFFASVRLSNISEFTGTLFIADFVPRKLTETEKKAFNTFASTICSLLELNQKKIYELKNDHNLPININSIISNISKDYQSLDSASLNDKSYWLEIKTKPVFEDNKLQDIIIESEVIDITEKKIKEANILNLISIQNSIFNAVSFAVIFTDVDGIIRRINKAGLDLIEYSNDEVIGRRPDFIHDFVEVKEKTLALSLELGRTLIPGKDTFVLKASLENKVDVNEWTYITKSGKRIPILLSITCVRNKENEIIGYVGVAEDYRAKKQVQEELINAKNAAETAAQAKNTFLANMSHEIRTPLNAIIGFTELLSQSNLDKLQQDFINNIQVAGDYLLVIINDILDLSKIESGQLVIESYPFNIATSLQHVYDLLKVKASQNNNIFNLIIADDLPELILGDKGRINQILVNLAGNAIKFTKNGSVTISLKKIFENVDTVILQFSVKDTGIGIPKDKLETIFERFTQAEASTTRKFGGSGLGLSIVKQLVAMQKGELFVESELGEGSEFRCTIPFKKVDSESIKNIQSNSFSTKSLGPLSILLCEDNHLNQILAKNVLQNFGFSLDIVNNGQEGIDALAIRSYDIILMDLQMPVMDGYQTTIYIRNTLKLKVPIIAMTAHSLVGEQQKCFEIGMNAYLAKPFKQIELLEKIQSVVDKNSIIERKMLDSTKEISKLPSSSKPALDLSYLETFSDGNNEFINQIIQLFIQEVPKDLTLLEQKIIERDFKGIKSVAHHMRSSLEMFKLDNAVKFLRITEQNAQNLSISPNVEPDFEIFKKDIELTLQLLSEKL